MASRHRRVFIFDETLRRMVERPIVKTEIFPEIMPDIADFVSTVDGSVIHGRRSLREHNKRHSVTNASDFTETWKKDEKRRVERLAGQDHDRSRTEAVARAYNQLQEFSRR